MKHNYGGYGNEEKWEEAFNTELARTAMKYVDRAGDYCEVDPAEKICDEFSEAMGDVVDRFCAMIGMPSEKYNTNGELKCIL